MQLEVKIDADAVQAQVVASIMQSAIGAQISAAINEALTKTTGDWSGRQTIVQRAVSSAVMEEVRTLAASIIVERRDELKRQIAERLNDEAMTLIVDALWEVMSNNIRSR